MDGGGGGSGGGGGDDGDGDGSGGDGGGSSSSRKSEEKCPPAGGIKMKVGGFKGGHCYHKPSDAAIQQEPSEVSSGVWLPRLSQDDFDRGVQTTHSGLLAVSNTEGRPAMS